MQRYLCLIAVIFMLAACGGPQVSVDPPTPVAVSTPTAVASAVGRILVPSQRDGVQLLVTDVSYMKLASGKYHFIVSFELTNLDRDQYKVTREGISFSDGAGKIYDPGLFNIHAPDKTSNDEYILTRNETQPFAVGGSLDSDQDVTFNYQPMATSDPMRVLIVSTPANPDSPFATLDLPTLAAPQGEFTQPIQLVVGKQETKGFLTTSFAEPERYLSGSVLNEHAPIGTYDIFVYDDEQNGRIIFDGRVRFYNLDQTDRLEQLGPISIYKSGLLRSRQEWVVIGGFVTCHATVLFYLNSDDPQLLPAENEFISYLDQLQQRLEPVVCR